MAIFNSYVCLPEGNIQYLTSVGDGQRLWSALISAVTKNADPPDLAPPENKFHTWGCSSTNKWVM